MGHGLTHPTTVGMAALGAGCLSGYRALRVRAAATSVAAGSMVNLSIPKQSASRLRPGPFVSHMPFKKQIVKIIRNEGTDEEGVTEVWAHIQAASGFIDLDTPISRATSLKWRIRRRGPLRTRNWLPSVGPGVQGSATLRPSSDRRTAVLALARRLGDCRCAQCAPREVVQASPHLDSCRDAVNLPNATRHLFTTKSVEIPAQAAGALRAPAARHAAAHRLPAGPERDLHRNGKATIARTTASPRSDAGYPSRRASTEMLLTPQVVVALTARSDRNR